MHELSLSYTFGHQCIKSQFGNCKKASFCFPGNILPRLRFHFLFIIFYLIVRKRKCLQAIFPRRRMSSSMKWKIYRCSPTNRIVREKKKVNTTKESECHFQDRKYNIWFKSFDSFLEAESSWTHLSAHTNSSVCFHHQTVQKGRRTLPTTEYEIEKHFRHKPKERKSLRDRIGRIYECRR